ncbi:amidohydrolase [Ammoniphilus sp. CFH 90114]|uniref:amidohydrolase n=1 Tax=Ammoniphilus sp. CFH 90114 TaxID=2493665 RepID=UPI00100FF3CD|nr:amidohydrolase [Ammoniphilus sp. CFH 90114]RXT04333.1 amidohydrolase [Ammoniphilus sp. CFH 90114]
MAVTIFINGKIYTQDPNLPLVEAVVVRDERIIDLGSTKDMLLQWGSPNAVTIDLLNHPVTPGLIDSHLHISSIGLKLLHLDLSGFGSKAELLASVRQKAEQTPLDEWVIGRGWDENLFKDGSGLPTIEELDAASLGRPLFLTRVCGHAFLVNHRALEISHYHPGIEVPSGGEIVVDSQTGKPTGLFLETASQLIRKYIPETSYDQLKQAVKQAMELSLELGLTSVHTEDLRYLGGFEQTYRIYDELIHQEGVGLRTNLLIYYPYLKALKEAGMYTGYGSPYLQIGALKIFADGALGRRTAYMSVPYQDDPNMVGYPVHDPEALTEIIRGAREHQMPIAVHVIGDKALEITLDGLDQFAPVAYRDRLIHTSVIRPDLLERLKHPSRMADLQPRFVPGDFPWLYDRLGEERAHYSYVWKTMMEAGIICAGGSDAPVEPLDPLLGLHAAVTRKAPGEDHPGWNPSEKLTIEEAVTLFTVGGAYATNEETVKGTITRGKWADMTVYSKDIFTSHPDELLSTKVVMTIVGGKVRYER